MWGWNKKRIYLDHAAAAPLVPEARKAMQPFLSSQFGNASSVHKEGQYAAAALANARESIARAISVQPAQVIFTGSGTEANNLALFGVLAAQPAGRAISIPGEHPSISRTLAALEQQGADVVLTPIDEDGRLVLDAFTELLTPETKLVTLAYANSETGVVQDVREVSRIIKAFNKTHGCNIVLHTDASQAPFWLPCSPEQLGVDMMTFDAGKCGGPKGVGMLINRSHINLEPQLYGGSQERGIRPGTENVAGIVGAATAFVRAVAGREARVERVAAIRNTALTALLEIEGVVLNGSKEYRLANNINISIPGIDSEYAVVVLDTNGIACSTRSACSGQDGSGSAVVQAMTQDAERAHSTLRFTLGENTSAHDMKRLTRVLTEHITKMRTFHNSLTRS